MQEFTPVAALAGGMLIGLGASILLIFTGRLAGISGILGNLLLGARGDRAWRGLFLGGLLAAGLVFALLAPTTFSASPRSLPLVAAAGLLVGVGTRLGNGCTSGHGVCGVSRLAPRSLIATLIFVLTGVLTVAALGWLGGAP